MSRGELAEPGDRFGIAGALGEHLGPEPNRHLVVVSLQGQRRQVATGQMSVYPLVDATELLGAPQGEDPSPAGRGLGRLASLPVENRLAEPQFGVLGIDR
jgi:hypothetical protein